MTLTGRAAFPKVRRLFPPRRRETVAWLQRPNSDPNYPASCRSISLSRARFTRPSSPTPRERAALARRFGLLALDRLEARLRLDHGGESLIRVTGRFEAEVTQACVVSLEPVHNLLEEAFSALYTLASAPVEHDIVIDPETEEPPEPADPRGIDLGEAVAQQLALALDPYPRAPGAKLAAIAANEASGGPEENYPFAVLKDPKTEQMRGGLPRGRNLAKKRTNRRLS